MLSVLASGFGRHPNCPAGIEEEEEQGREWDKAEKKKMEGD